MVKMIIYLGGINRRHGFPFLTQPDYGEFATDLNVASGQRYFMHQSGQNLLVHSLICSSLIQVSLKLPAFMVVRFANRLIPRNAEILSFL